MSAEPDTPRGASAPALAWFLLSRAMRNRLARLLARVREPRVAIGVAGGCLFLGVALIGLGAAVFFDLELGTGSDLSPLFTGGLVAWLLLLLRSGGREPGLPLPKATLLQLIAAPLGRRRLLAFFIWTHQPGLLLSALFFSLLLGFYSPCPPWLAWPQLILLLNAQLALSLCARLWTCMARDGGHGDGVSCLPYHIVLVALLTALVMDLPPLEGSSPEEFLATFSGPTVQTVLWPLIQIAEGLHAQTLAGVLPSLAVLGSGWLVLLVAALLRPPAFEEAWLRFADRVEALKSGGWAAYKHKTAQQTGKARPTATTARPQPFRLKPGGNPLWALVWKNLIGMGRRHRPRNLLVALVLAAAGGSSLAVLGAGTPLPPAGAVLVVYLTLLAVLIAMQHLRYDLRRDLVHTAQLKSYPLSARQVLYGEVLGMTITVSAYVTVGLTLALFLASSRPGQGGALVALAWSERLPVYAALVLLAAATVFVDVAIANICTLVAPHLVVIGRRQKGGFAQFGGALTGNLVRGVALLACQVLPLTVGIGTYALFGIFAGAWYLGALPAGLLAAGVLVAEGVAGLRWAERAYERFDLADVPKRE